MSIYRRAAKADESQAEIVAALRAIGCEAWYIRQPMDLLVRTKGGWLVMECKNGRRAKSAQRLTNIQLEFIGKAENCPVAVVNDAESAIRAVKMLESK